MSKYLSVSSGDYTIIVKNGGDIVFDASDGSGGNPGVVRVRGDLEVQGTTTTFNSTELAIEDNVIILNEGETDAGVNETIAGGVSGVQIDRGTEVDAQWVFDESIQWANPQNAGTSSSGGWSPRLINGDVIGIEAVSITTPNGTDLNLLGVYNGPGGSAVANPGKLTVKGTVDYEDRITEDDDIPNKKYIDDEIQRQLDFSFQDRIEEPSGGAFPTYVETQSNAVTGSTSRVVLGVDGNLIADFRELESTIHDVKIVDNQIRSAQANQDLVITADGIGSVIIDDNIVLTKTPHNGTAVVDPVTPGDGVKVYAKAEGTAGTGIYFVNEDDTRDELVSRNRALVYSMIF